MLLVAFATLSGLLSGFVFPILNNEQLHPASEPAPKKSIKKNANEFGFFSCFWQLVQHFRGPLFGFVFPILKNQQLRPASDSASKNTLQKKNKLVCFGHVFGSFCNIFVGFCLGCVTSSPNCFFEHLHPASESV